MNWDAIGAIAELLGAIGVIASLVYLATQIRQSREQMGQSTRAMQASTFQQFDQTLQGAFSNLLTAPGAARAFRRGASEYSELDEDERWLFGAWVSGMLMRVDNGYYQYRAGMLDEASWQMLLRILRGYARMPGVVQMWRERPDVFLSPEFSALVEEILAEEAERGGGAHG
jgi:hypothetical protein